MKSILFFLRDMMLAILLTSCITAACYATFKHFQSVTVTGHILKKGV